MGYIILNKAYLKESCFQSLLSRTLFSRPKLFTQRSYLSLKREHKVHENVMSAKEHKTSWSSIKKGLPIATL